jgi:hypothetical protein
MHLDRIKDWSLPLECTHSSTQSGMPSSDSESVEYPKIYNFEDWVPRVVDGRWPLPRHPSCHLPLAHVPRRQDRDDDDDNGGPRRPPRGILDRGCVALNLFHSSTGGSSGDGMRERTHSPVPHRQRDEHDHGAPADGSRGRSAVRGGRGIWRPRDPPRRDDSVDWERRKSRSPDGRVPHKDPLGFHPDPMMEFYKSLCVDGLLE